MVAAAVLYVKDLPGMREFYETCFSLRVASPLEDEACVLESEDWELALVAVPTDVAETVVISIPPKPRTATPIKLAFEVASLEALRRAVLAAGGQVDILEWSWEFRGRLHLDVLDPEGNVVQLRQRLAEHEDCPQTTEN
jgi:predicted enzyme related to lactoylglutathione lyase